MDEDKIIDKLISDFKNEQLEITENDIANFIKLKRKQKKIFNLKSFPLILIIFLIIGASAMVILNVDNLIKNAKHTLAEAPVLLQLKSKTIVKLPDTLSIKKSIIKVKKYRQIPLTKKAKKVIEINNLVNTDLLTLKYNNIYSKETELIDLTSYTNIYCKNN